MIVRISMRLVGVTLIFVTAASLAASFYVVNSGIEGYLLLAGAPQLILFGFTFALIGLDIVFVAVLIQMRAANKIKGNAVHQ